MASESSARFSRVSAIRERDPMNQNEIVPVDDIIKHGDRKDAESIGTEAKAEMAEMATGITAQILDGLQL